MRFLRLIVASSLIFGSCAGPRIGNAPIRGWFDSLSMADVQAAVAVDQASRRGQNKEIYEVVIAWEDEIHIYHMPRNNHLEVFDIVRRVRGQWRTDGRAIVQH
jgi:hypothetical protein